MNVMSTTEHFPQDSKVSELQLLVRRNDVWSPLGYDTKVAVFKFLRPYDIRKFCVYVNKSWASFCVDNEKYIPCPAPLRTVKQFPKTPNLLSSSELEAKRQRQQQARHRFFLSSLAFLAILLATWSCIVYLIVKINNQSEEDSTDDLLALCFFMVLSLSKTRYLKDCYHDECCMPRMPWGAGLWGYDNRTERSHRRKRRRWSVWLCFRLVLCFVCLSFNYFMPHLTPPTWALWIALTVIHIPDCHEFFLWIKWTNPKLCLQPSFGNGHRLHDKCPIVQQMFTILVSIPHFATLIATFLTFHPDKAINIPSLIIFIFLISIVTVYKEHHGTFYGLCLGAISTLYPRLYPGKNRNEEDIRRMNKSVDMTVS